jgi:hypothetical protein
MKVIFVLIMSFVFLLGCETVHQGAKEVGKPIGKAASAVGGVSEGATEGYVGQTTSEENPYGR